MKPILKALFISSLLVIELTCNAQYLVIRLKGTDGNPAIINKAELLVSYWSDNERLPLQTKKNKVFIDLTQEWFKKSLKKREPDQIMAVNIYIEPKSHAPMLSDPFTPPCINSPNTATTHTISFQGGSSTLLEPGRNVSLVLAVRRKDQKIVRIIDPSNNPIKGINITARMGWSCYNHCGVVEDTDPLGCWTTNDDGTAAIPDGDIYYELEFLAPEYFLANPESNYAQNILRTRLKRPVTTMVMKKTTYVNLKVQVTRNGQPAPGLNLAICVRKCPCGACCGTFAITNERGIAISNRLSPDLDEKLYIADSKGKVLWEKVIDNSYQNREYKVELGDIKAGSGF